MWKGPRQLKANKGVGIPVHFLILQTEMGCFNSNVCLWEDPDCRLIAQTLSLWLLFPDVWTEQKEGPRNAVSTKVYGFLSTIRTVSDILSSLLFIRSQCLHGGGAVVYLSVCVETGSYYTQSNQASVLMCFCWGVTFCFLLLGGLCSGLSVRLVISCTPPNGLSFCAHFIRRISIPVARLNFSASTIRPITCWS